MHAAVDMALLVSTSDLLVYNLSRVGYMLLLPYGALYQYADANDSVTFARFTLRACTNIPQAAELP